MGKRLGGSSLTLSLLIFLASWSLPADAVPQTDNAVPTKHARHANLVAHRGVPEAGTDWSFAPFSDQGAWFGFALPPEDRPELRGGFTGPFLMSNGRWLSPQLLRLSLVDAESGLPLRFIDASTHSADSFPGLLRETMEVDGLSVNQSLWFDRIGPGHSGMALIRVSIENTTKEDRLINVGWTGFVFEGSRVQTDAGNRLWISGEDYRFRLSFGSGMGDLESMDNGFSAREKRQVSLGAGESVMTSVAIDLSLEDDEMTPGEDIDASLANIQESYNHNRERWSRWLDAVTPTPGTGRAAGIIAVKSLQTMISNWRGPAGRLDHHGMFPSHNVWYFNGYWAWDTWKQAVGVLKFDPDLAKALVKGMFRHQDANGMIADVVYLDADEDNWRDTKPPLAGWAIDAIYQATGDLEFVREMYPKLVTYHQFWYRDRDHDRDGLCEYGSTDGTLEAARWESGMDNAVRFDNTSMLRNSDSTWSMDQESVDLNAYLYVEKQALARLANALGEDGERWEEEARELKARIRETFYLEDGGWFHDIDIEGESFIMTQSPEGWIPLWAGVASDEQARRSRDVMLDPGKFRTHVPFPTVAADDPEFSEGYWRGLVWLDQVYFAIEGLRRYGYRDDANDLTRQLFANLDGVGEAGVPIYENYHPLNGEGRNVRHFSWSAAHLLMLAGALE